MIESILEDSCVLSVSAVLLEGELYCVDIGSHMVLLVPADHNLQEFKKVLIEASPPQDSLT